MVRGWRKLDSVTWKFKLLSDGRVSASYRASAYVTYMYSHISQGEGGWSVTKKIKLLVTFFNSLRKVPMVCRGLDLDLSGKVAKKTTLTRKRGRHAHIVWDHPIPPPSYRCVRNLPPSTAEAAATAYTHINVAIVTRSHFGN